MEALLKVENLVVHYETHNAVVEAVNDVSFEIMPGQTLGPVGETGEVKDTITVAVNAEPSVLDPPNQQSGTAGMVNVQIFEGLVRLDNDTGEIVPAPQPLRPHA